MHPRAVVHVRFSLVHISYRIFLNKSPLVSVPAKAHVCNDRAVPQEQVSTGHVYLQIHVALHVSKFSGSWSPS